MRTLMAALLAIVVGAGTVWLVTELLAPIKAVLAGAVKL